MKRITAAITALAIGTTVAPATANARVPGWLMTVTATKQAHTYRMPGLAANILIVAKEDGRDFQYVSKRGHNVVTFYGDGVVLRLTQRGLVHYAHVVSVTGNRRVSILYRTEATP